MVMAEMKYYLARIRDGKSMVCCRKQSRPRHIQNKKRIERMLLKRMRAALNNDYPKFNTFEEWQEYWNVNVIQPTYDKWLKKAKERGFIDG